MPQRLNCVRWILIFFFSPQLLQFYPRVCKNVFQFLCTYQKTPVNNECHLYLTFCVPCNVTNYVNGPIRCTILYIYLFYNFHVHSTCFERSSSSSSAVYRTVLYYTALYNRANVSSCFGLTANTGTNSLILLVLQRRSYRKS